MLQELNHFLAPENTNFMSYEVITFEITFLKLYAQGQVFVNLFLFFYLEEIVLR